MKNDTDKNSTEWLGLDPVIPYDTGPKLTLKPTESQARLASPNDNLDCWAYKQNEAK